MVIRSSESRSTPAELLHLPDVVNKHLTAVLERQEEQVQQPSVREDGDLAASVQANGDTRGGKEPEGCALVIRGLSTFASPRQLCNSDTVLKWCMSARAGGALLGR